MTKETALAKGLEFTGVYERNSGKVKKELEEIRKQGYKAYFVTVPDSPLSRGGVGVGYSVYAEPRYRADRNAETVVETVAKYDEHLQYLKSQYEKQVADAEKAQSERLEYLKRYREMYPSKMYPVKKS
jgi:hypothetical protein